MIALAYVPFVLEQVVRIRRLYSLYYFPFASGYVFPGEKHNFWEMVYLDRGEADIGAGERMLRLSPGQVIFHQPNEFHSIWANYASAPNIMVITFAAGAPCMRRFRGFSHTLDGQQRRLLQQLLEEAERCFGPLLDSNSRMLPLETAPIGSQQLIGNYLEQLLILLLRGMEAEAPKQARPVVTQQHEAVELIERVMQFMRGRLDGSLRFEDILRAAGVGQTTLKQAFRQHAKTGVMACYQQLRLEEARRLLRTGRYNVTQTAEALGYPSIHAFSRQFVRVMGMTPGAYLRSVRM